MEVQKHEDIRNKKRGKSLSSLSFEDNFLKEEAML